MTNRLLLEAGTGTYRSRYGGGQVPGLETENLIRVVEQCADRLRRQRQHSRADVSLAATGPRTSTGTRSGTPAASFVTGSHSIKVGYQGALLYRRSEELHEL